jgi:hypothetical protein
LGLVLGSGLGLWLGLGLGSWRVVLQVRIAIPHALWFVRVRIIVRARIGIKVQIRARFGVRIEERVEGWSED